MPSTGFFSINPRATHHFPNLSRVSRRNLIVLAFFPAVRCCMRYARTAAGVKSSNVRQTPASAA